MNQPILRDPDFLQAILDAYPDPAFIIDGDHCVVACNEAGYSQVNEGSGKMLRKHKGEALHCLTAVSAPGGCGSTPGCSDCVLNNSLDKAIAGGRVVRAWASIDVVTSGEVTESHYSVTASPFSYDGGRYVLLVLEDINELILMKQILPICSNCKKIRDDRQYWENVDSYFKKYLDLSFSHGLCPQCMDLLYPEFREKDE
ncbi:MAG: hypothetical protein C4534_05575 [Gaiellales bacterium]|nr:MAG: hypothetical protein C4534_05575 [Gaiellales bacterium]